MPQTHVVDYPLLAYKTFSPRNREICIVHLAMNVPQRVVHLGEWEFLCFVGHTQMVEQKLFQRSKETNCDIMFLVRRGAEVRLMSFKSNPWLDVRQQLEGEDPDIYRQALFLFSGSLHMLPTEDRQGE